MMVPCNEVKSHGDEFKFVKQCAEGVKERQGPLGPGGNQKDCQGIKGKGMITKKKNKKTPWEKTHAKKS